MPTCLRRSVAAEPQGSLVVVSPDAGSPSCARKIRYSGLALRSQSPTRCVRVTARLPSSSRSIGEVVESTTLVIVDDFTISAGTLGGGRRSSLSLRGARSVHAAVSPTVLQRGSSMDRLDASPIERLIMTDFDRDSARPTLTPKVTVVSVAPLFAEAIGRIHRRESISVLFQE